MLTTITKTEMEILINITKNAFTQVSEDLDLDLQDYPATVLTQSFRDLSSLSKKIEKMVDEMSAKND